MPAVSLVLRGAGGGIIKVVVEGVDTSAMTMY